MLQWGLVMRILVLSDIHSNLAALDAVLMNAPSYDAVWCLGDIVGYGPAPNECVARVRALDALTLAGNHDWAVLGKAPLEHFREIARAALEWTRGALSPENTAWLDTLEPLKVLPEYDMTLVHASPREPIWEYIEDAETALENFPSFTTSSCLFGHTHRPIAYWLRAAERVLSTQTLPEAQPYRLQPKLLLNPGSVGQPRDGDPRAAFALLDTDSKRLTYLRVEYDIAATQRAIIAANLPHRLAARLAQGV